MFLLGENISPFVVGVAVDDIAVLVNYLGYISVAVVQVVVIAAAYFPGQGLVAPDRLRGNIAVGVGFGDDSAGVVVVVSGGARRGNFFSSQPFGIVRIVIGLPTGDEFGQLVPVVVAKFAGYKSVQAAIVVGGYCPVASAVVLIAYMFTARPLYSRQPV